MSKEQEELIKSYRRFIIRKNLEREFINQLEDEIDKEVNETDAEGYELNEDGYRISCCGDVLDDTMICPTCKEHC